MPSSVARRAWQLRGPACHVAVLTRGARCRERARLSRADARRARSIRFARETVGARARPFGGTRAAGPARRLAHFGIVARETRGARLHDARLASATFTRRRLAGATKSDASIAPEPRAALAVEAGLAVGAGAKRMARTDRRSRVVEPDGFACEAVRARFVTGRAGRVGGERLHAR